MLDMRVIIGKGRQWTAFAGVAFCLLFALPVLAQNAQDAAPPPREKPGVFYQPKPKPIELLTDEAYAKIVINSYQSSLNDRERDHRQLSHVND